MLQNPETDRLHAVAEILNQAYFHGGGTLLVDGLSGMGKTHFLRNLALHAADSGTWKVTFINADRFEVGEPYSFIERLLAAGIAPHWTFDPEEQQQPIALARDIVKQLLSDDANPEAGHVIIVDDAHWVDDKSMRVLRHMIPRVNRRNVFFACGARTPHASGSLGEFLTDAATTNPHDHHIAMAPLTEDEIRALAMHRFQVTISKRNAERLAELTGGSFLGVDSIFNQVTDSEIQQLHTTWDLPIRKYHLENPLLGTYRELSTGAQRLAAVVCIAEHELPYETLVAVCKKFDIDPDIQEAREAGVIMESSFGHAIVPKHALISAAVRDSVDPECTRNIHRALADLTEGFRSVVHMLKGATSLNPDLLERTKRYAHEATQQQQFSNACKILRMALALAQTPEDRELLLTELALTNIRAKTGFQCLDILPDLEALPYSLLREFLVIMLSVYLVDQPLPRQRIRDVLSATDTTPDEKMLQAFLLFMMVMMSMRSTDRSEILTMIPPAKALFSQAPQHPEELADARLAWMVLPQEYILLLDCFELVQWHLNGETTRVAEALPELLDRTAQLPSIPIKVDCLVPLAGAAMATGDVILAHDIASQAVDLLDHVSGQPWGAATPRIILAHTQVLLGTYQQAVNVLDTLEEVSHDSLELEARLTAAGLRATIAAITEADDALQYVAHARRTMDFTWEHYGRDLFVMAKLEIARVGEDPAGMVTAASIPYLPTIANTQQGFLTFKAHALISLGELDQARTLLGQLHQQRGTSWFEYWGTLDWLEARLAQVTEDFAGAKRSYELALKQRLFPLPWALTATDYGKFLLANGQPEAAETILREALSLLEKIGATAYAPHTQQHLSTAIDRNRQSHTDAIAAMTTREREVAELLAQGYSNKTIAELLVVSESTARFHVSNILRKLQLSSRAEVPQMLKSMLRP